MCPEQMEATTSKFIINSSTAASSSPFTECKAAAPAEATKNNSIISGGERSAEQRFCKVRFQSGNDGGESSKNNNSLPSPQNREQFNAKESPQNRWHRLSRLMLLNAASSQKRGEQPKQQNQKQPKQKQKNQQNSSRPVAAMSAIAQLQQKSALRLMATSEDDEEEDDEDEDDDDESSSNSTPVISSNLMHQNNSSSVVGDSRRRLMRRANKRSGGTSQIMMPSSSIYRNSRKGMAAAAAASLNSNSNNKNNKNISSSLTTTKNTASAFLPMHLHQQQKQKQIHLQSQNIRHHIHHHHSNTTSISLHLAGSTGEHRRRRKSRLDSGSSDESSAASAAHAKFCLFGVLRVETGARLFLLFYVALSTCGVALGSVATMVWVLVPLVVVPLAAYSLSRHSSKYLYPFLVVSVIHSLVSFGMMFIVGCFSLLCFDQLKAHFDSNNNNNAAFPSPPTLLPTAADLSSSIAPSSSPSRIPFASSSASSSSSPSASSLFPFFTTTSSSPSLTASLYCAAVILLSLGLALIFCWQSIVLLSCISHFDLLAQQRRQAQQNQNQLLQHPAATSGGVGYGIESRVHSLASAPVDTLGGRGGMKEHVPVEIVGGGGGGTHSRQMECQQCISEIRNLGQFSELRASNSLNRC